MGSAETSDGEPSSPPRRHIVVGQSVDAIKTMRARQLRRDMTPAERILWGVLRGHRLLGLQFRRQQVIAGFIVDFYCHAVGLVIEVDGAIHDDQIGHDTARDGILAARGLRILRLTNEEVLHHLDRALEQIVEACR